MSRRLLALSSTLGLLLVLFAPTAEATPITVKVMTLNIFYGGDEWNLDTGQWCADAAGCPETIGHVVSAIQAADPDIVGFQEGTANECVIADILGWYCEPRLQLISRFPLVDPPGANGVYVLAEVATGRFVAVSNVHLPSDPYGPYWVRDGEPRAAVLELERTTRLPAIQQQLDVLPGLADDGMPVFLTGDFNSPSHLDWTPAVDAVREEVRYPVSWPVSAALADAGFRDSYREIHPDPVAVPGFTWTPPGTLESVPDEVNDRIDWVLVQGPAETVATELVGEAGGPDVDIERDPYPTDHRGVVSTFRVEAADLPPFAAVAARRVFVGEDLDVRVHGPASRVVLVPKGQGPGAALASRAVGGADVTLTFPTSAVSPGRVSGAPAERRRHGPVPESVLAVRGGDLATDPDDAGRLRGGRADPGALAGRARVPIRLDGRLHPRARPGAERGGLQRGELRERPLPPVPLHGHADPRVGADRPRLLPRGIGRGR